MKSDDAKGRGGDALVSQYLGSNVTIHGGNFLAGRGSVRDGHSLRASYDGAEIHVRGGTYYGSWMAQSGGGDRRLRLAVEDRHEACRQAGGGWATFVGRAGIRGGGREGRYA